MLMLPAVDMACHHADAAVIDAATLIIIDYDT